MSDELTHRSITTAFRRCQPGRAAKRRPRRLGRDARFEPREAAPDEIPELIRAAASSAGRGGRQRVLVCGGDGTIAAAIGAAAGTALELGVLPAGTLNHFARDYGLPLDPAEALEVAATASSQPIDVGVVNGRVMVNTASVGAYVDFVRHRESRERYLGYHLASLIARSACGFVRGGSRSACERTTASAKASARRCVRRRR
jgi:diacylglycerol kinase family enzyme